MIYKPDVTKKIRGPKTTLMIEGGLFNAVLLKTRMQHEHDYVHCLKYEVRSVTHAILKEVLGNFCNKVA